MIKLGTFLTLTFLLCESVSAKSLLLNFPRGGDFILPSAGRSTIDTSKLRGSNIFIVFGFSNCKSVCPMTLNNLRTFRKQLTPEEQKNVKIIFVSVDNERDTLEKLKVYTSAFDPDILSGTTSDGKLKKILGAFGARYYRFRTKNKALLVDHTSDVFLINKKGIWSHTLPFDATPQKYLTALKESDNISSIELRFPESRLVELTSSKGCNLTVANCQLHIRGQMFSVELPVRPIISQADLQLVIRKNSPGPLTPLEVDFQGVELSMGHIRPAFQQQSSDHFAAAFNLPFCELPSMHWQLTIVFKDGDNKFIGTKLKIKSEK